MPETLGTAILMNVIGNSKKQKNKKKGRSLL
jgi:hypothetical protein